jgi:anti-sigma regulatory factor (Ser/Thr protein kinase)
LGSNSYIPIQVVDIDKWKAESIDSRYADVVDERASELAHILTQRRGGEDFKAIQYSLREILRNAVEHSIGRVLSFFAQYWPNGTPRSAEIVIWDNGCGLRQSLNTNYAGMIGSDSEALQLSLRPGVSGVTEEERAYQPEDIRNSGFGLYTTSRFASEVGFFRMISGSAGLTLHGNTIVHHDWIFQGTCVQLKLDLDRIGNVSEKMARIISEGEAVINGSQGEVASPASRALSKWLSD